MIVNANTFVVYAKPTHHMKMESKYLKSRFLNSNCNSLKLWVILQLGNNIRSPNLQRNLRETRLQSWHAIKTTWLKKNNNKHKTYCSAQKECCSCTNHSTNGVSKKTDRQTKEITTTQLEGKKHSYTITITYTYTYTHTCFWVLKWTYSKYWCRNCQNC